MLILLGGGGLYFYKNYDKEEDVVLDDKPLEKKDKKDEEIEEKEKLISVDIKGEINAPGMYSIKTNMRVIDVINMAGGLTENADTTVINLSKRVVDEMVIIVYSREQVMNFEETKKNEEYILDKCIMPDENSLKNDACIDNNQNTSGKININTATLEDLMRLSGIGESKAKAIISYREQNGEFKSIEDIKKVPGIGESIYAQIKETITV